MAFIREKEEIKTGFQDIGSCHRGGIRGSVRG